MSPSEPEVVYPVATTAVAQHRTFLELLAVIEDTDDVRRATALLEDLVRELDAHFAEEERPGGLLDGILGAAYSQDRAVEGFRREHLELMAEAKATLAAARQCLRAPVSNVLRRASLLAVHLRGHEQRESAADVEALYAESGGSE